MPVARTVRPRPLSTPPACKAIDMTTTRMTTPRNAAAVGLRVIAGAVACGACAAATLPVLADEGSPPAARRVVVDPQVTTAGGHACRACDSGQCRLHGHCGHRHHPECRDGLCVPFCPVRPSTFGFYGTQWRRWPGQGVVPASAEDAVTPMPPPKSAVPGPDEESPMRPDETGGNLEPQPDATAEERSDARDDVVVPDAEVPAEPMPPGNPQAPVDVVPEPKPTVRDEPAAVPDEPTPTKPAAPTTPTTPQRLPSLEDILGGAETTPVPRTEPVPRESDRPSAPKAESPADIFDVDEGSAPGGAPPSDGRDEDATPDADTGNPFDDDSASAPDAGVELAGFRYPATVGGSLAPGGKPWQLTPPPRQRAADSPRGR